MADLVASALTSIFDPESDPEFGRAAGDLPLMARPSDVRVADLPTWADQCESSLTPAYEQRGFGGGGVQRGSASGGGGTSNTHRSLFGAEPSFDGPYGQHGQGGHDQHVGGHHHAGHQQQGRFGGSSSSLMYGVRETSVSVRETGSPSSSFPNGDGRFPSGDYDGRFQSGGASSSTAPVVGAVDGYGSPAAAVRGPTSFYPDGGEDSAPTEYQHHEGAARAYTINPSALKTGGGPDCFHIASEDSDNDNDRRGPRPSGSDPPWTTTNEAPTRNVSQQDQHNFVQWPVQEEDPFCLTTLPNSFSVDVRSCRRVKLHFGDMTSLDARALAFDVAYAFPERGSSVVPTSDGGVGFHHSGTTGTPSGAATAYGGGFPPPAPMYGGGGYQHGSSSSVVSRPPVQSPELEPACSLLAVGGARPILTEYHQAASLQSGQVMVSTLSPDNEWGEEFGHRGQFADEFPDRSSSNAAQLGTNGGQFLTALGPNRAIDSLAGQTIVYPNDAYVGPSLSHPSKILRGGDVLVVKGNMGNLACKVRLLQ